MGQFKSGDPERPDIGLGIIFVTLNDLRGHPTRLREHNGDQNDIKTGAPRETHGSNKRLALAQLWALYGVRMRVRGMLFGFLVE